MNKYTSRQVFCEGYQQTNKVKLKETDLHLSIDGEGEYNIRWLLDNLAGRVVKKDNLALDLLRIASYVYIADCQTERGGFYDPYDENYNVDFRFYIPVLNPNFWNKPKIRSKLAEVLKFASGHSFQFEFCQLPKQKNLSEIIIFAEPSL